jgi:Polyribonucleotide phosphorylase C terminal.
MPAELPAAAVTEAVQENSQRAQLKEQAETAQDEQDDSENRDGANMPRRSRRSPRHLRVSGQRRRRYRDERYPTQSAMPLETAAASPEMASGKVWITYPVTQTHEHFTSNQALNEMPDYGYQDAAPAEELPVAVEAAAVAQPETPAPEVVHQAEPQAHTEVPVVNTDDLTPVAAPVDHQPAVISAADEAVAQETVAEAQPAVTPAEDTPPLVTEVVTEAVSAAEQAPIEVSPAVEAQVEEVLSAPVAAEAPVAPVTEPHAPVAARDTGVSHAETRFKHHATAPMTKAPAPAWEPEPVRHSDWVRPAFNFEGRGSAGGHSATHQATAPATRPESA